MSMTFTTYRAIKAVIGPLTYALFIGAGYGVFIEAYQAAAVSVIGALLLYTAESRFELEIAQSIASRSARRAEQAAANVDALAEATGEALSEAVQHKVEVLIDHRIRAVEGDMDEVVEVLRQRVAAREEAEHGDVQSQDEAIR